MDEDNDVNIGSSDDDSYDDSTPTGRQYYHGGTENDDSYKRDNHNRMERVRRDQIKDSFHSLRNSVPSLAHEQEGRSAAVSRASRAKILQTATEYITEMITKNRQAVAQITEIKRQNRALEKQAADMELATAIATGGGGGGVPAPYDQRRRHPEHQDHGRRKRPYSSEEEEEGVPQHEVMNLSTGRRASGARSGPVRSLTMRTKSRSSRR